MSSLRSLFFMSIDPYLAILRILVFRRKRWSFTHFTCIFDNSATVHTHDDDVICMIACSFRIALSVTKCP